MTRTGRLLAAAAAAFALVTAATTTPAAADPPTISGAINPAPDPSGWNTGPVTVEFTCDDVDADLANCTADTPVDDDGVTVVQGVATDLENNVATTEVEVKIDSEGPLVFLKGSGPQNKQGYYTGPVTVTATCADGLSGVAICPAPVVVDTEGPNNVMVQAEDVAGNTTDASIVITIDKTGPTITPTINGTLGDNGWYVSPVSISYVCNDAGSGVRRCPPTSQVRNDGTTTVRVAAADNLGRTTILDTIIKKDTKKPSASITKPARKGIAPGSNITGKASDQTSGVDTVEVSFDGGAPTAVTLQCQGGGKTCTWSVAEPGLGAGTHTASVTVTDKAGNTYTSPNTTFIVLP